MIIDAEQQIDPALFGELQHVVELPGWLEIVMGE